MGVGILMLGTDSFHNGVLPTPAVHTALFGMTGMGKSTLIEHMLDMRKGFILFDCEGEASERILAMIPRDRTEDVIVIDPLAERVPGISFLRPGGEQDVVQFFRNNWKDSWGARSEWLMSNLVYALLASDMLPHFGFASISKLLSSASFREHIGKGTDIFGKEFLAYLKRLNPRFKDEVVMPIVGKLDMLVRNEACRVLFGQSDSSFDFAEAMDKQRIVIVRIPQGELGDMSRFIGSALFTLVTREALRRKSREPYYMVLDELQEYAQGMDLSRVLATTRKFGLFCHMAVTNIEQLDQPTVASILSNCGVLAVYRTSARDAERLAPELATDMQPRSILELQQFHCLYGRRGGALPSSAVILKVLPPRSILPERGARIRKASLTRWGRPRKKVLRLVEEYLRKSSG